MKILDLEAKPAEEISLPEIFSTKYRPDLINKAFLVFMSQQRQRYGANVLAGLRSSAHYHGKRDYRYTMMNREMARIARIHGRVGFLHMTARVVPQSVKGRKAHPPKAAKKWALKMNKKEGMLAMRSALSANEPVVFTNDLENINKTKKASVVLSKLINLKKYEKKKVRPGKGKMRNRRYKRKTGPLIIVSQKCSLVKAARNIPGIDVVLPQDLNIGLLAPGGNPRKVILTKNALSEIERVLS